MRCHPLNTIVPEHGFAGSLPPKQSKWLANHGGLVPDLTLEFDVMLVRSHAVPLPYEPAKE